MKKISIVVFLVLSLLLVCSCSLIKEQTCYYAYFKDTAFVLLYSPVKNTLYEIQIAPEVISQWGRSQNISSIPDAMRSFATLEDSGFMVGIPQSLEAVRAVLNAMTDKAEPSAEDRLAVLATRAADFTDASLLSKMNTLCGTDVTALINVLKNTNAKVCILDTKDMLKADDPVFSQKYFKKYLTQVMGK